VFLWAQSQSKGYGSALWGTYQQWQALGGQVRRGEHGSPVVFRGTWEGKRTDDEDEDGRSDRHLFAKGYTVFNLEQVEGCRLPRKLEEPKLTQNERISRADGFFNSLLGLQVRDGGNRAFYRPDTDVVYMPGFDQFSEPKASYSVLVRENTHWTSSAGMQPGAWEEVWR
jgi:antirestriction protein ArdC